MSGRQQADDGVDPRDLERLVRREAGQEAGESSSKHRLPRAGRAGEQEVVTAGCRDLERAPPALLATDILEIGMGDGRRPAVRRLVRRRLTLAAQVRRCFREMAERHGLDACERGFGRRAGGAQQPLEPALPCALRGREHAAHRPHAAVERQLAEGGVSVQSLARDLMRRCEHRDRDGQVEAGAFLPQARRREVHGDPVPRPLEARSSHARPHAVLCLLARTVGEADDREAGQAALDVRLHLHAPRVEADESVGDRAREHTIERSLELHARLRHLCADSAR